MYAFRMVLSAGLGEAIVCGTADFEALRSSWEDIAFLIERDAAREARVAELEAELAQIKSTPQESCEQLVRDVAAALKRDRVGLNRAVDASASEIVGAANVVSAHFRDWRARLLGERIPELADIDKFSMAALAAEKRAGRAELELLEIRERARVEIAGAVERLDRLEQRGAGPDKVYEEACLARDVRALVERVVGLESGKGGGDAAP
jgi:hypothetical protein